MDAVEWLRNLPDACADLIVTDPPYESLEKHRAIGTTTRLKHSKASSNDWFHVFPNNRFRELSSELYRVLRRNRHCYIFCDQETMFVLKPVVEKAGFRFWKPIVWDKVTMGMGYHYRARYEFVLFFEKGKRRLNDLSIPDVLEFKRVRNGYPAEKPLELIQTLIMQSSEEVPWVTDAPAGIRAWGAVCCHRSTLRNAIDRVARLRSRTVSTATRYSSMCRRTSSSHSIRCGSRRVPSSLRTRSSRPRTSQSTCIASTTSKERARLDFLPLIWEGVRETIGNHKQPRLCHTPQRAECVALD